MFRAHQQFQRMNAIKQLKYTQEDVDAMLDLKSCQPNNLLTYLYETRSVSLDLSASSMKHFFRPQVNNGECYQFHYLHEAERKYVLYNFVYEFFRDKSNDHFELMCVETLATVDVN
jgi:regulatory protein YycI of two-component signal transduction system YycFG